jgi:hypothetical protein
MEQESHKLKYDFPRSTQQKQEKQKTSEKIRKKVQKK